MRNLKGEIKRNIDAPSRDIKVFVVSFHKTNNSEKLFMVSCFQSTMTSNLALVDEDDDNGKIITYSEKELEKRKFKLSDVVKIMNAIKNRSISLSSSKSSISDILRI
ncbi:MAG: hypothetical protein EOO43_22325 [Flavobacterium sp.]|nr:MAG: hypothetical protein EOO43_22325 [Flavobacterium sp.]